jgi:hypothetical protein
VWNNGSGVPVEMHKKEGVYVPELIFGHLLTSSNYEDNQKKVCSYHTKKCQIVIKQLGVGRSELHESDIGRSPCGSWATSV